MIRNSLLALALLSQVSSHAQTSQAELQARLLHKPLYLVGRWRDDHLKFDALGQLRGKSDTGPFTTSGIDVQTVEVSAKGLALRGSRVGLVFRPDGIDRITIGEGNNGGGHPETVVIQIAPPADGVYGPALDAILTTDLSKFVPSLPDFWQGYANEHLMHARVEIAMSEGPDGPPEPEESFDKPKPTPGFAASVAA